MSINYQMWLTHNAESDKLRIPVLPETFKIRNGSSNSSVNVMGLGEITIMQDRPALQFGFSSFFPATRFPGLGPEEIPDPLEAIERINDWKASDKPVRFVCTSAKISLYATIEDFSYEERGGDVGTYYYDISLKEYREIKARQVKIDIENKTATVPKEDTQRVNNTTTPDTYEVKPGDYLIKIAKKLYGDESKWRTIYEANKSIIGGNPNLIYAGQVFTIPK